MNLKCRKLKSMSSPSKFVKEKFAKIEWESGKLKKSQVKLSNLSTEHSAFKQAFVLVETFETFIQCKDARYEEEDLPFTAAVSSLMDLRNWENENLKQKENEEHETFVGRLKNLESVREKCDKGDAFWEDMDAEEVKMEFDILNILRRRKSCKSCRN